VSNDFKPYPGENADRCADCGVELENGECVVIGCASYEVSVGRGPGVADAPVPPAPTSQVIDLFDALKSALGGA
jgi:hypothetical protein